MGRRLPIGAEATIKSVTPDDFRDYYKHWYVPSNMTVIVVGDTDPAMVVDVITRHFGAGATVPTSYIIRRRGPLEPAYEDRLHVHMHRLLRKIERKKRPRYIISDRGVGYMFQTDAQ